VRRARVPGRFQSYLPFVHSSPHRKNRSLNDSDAKKQVERLAAYAIFANTERQIPPAPNFPILSDIYILGIFV
jgi:hypothetical protein